MVEDLQKKEKLNNNSGQFCKIPLVTLEKGQFCRRHNDKVPIDTKTSIELNHNLFVLEDLINEERSKKTSTDDLTCINCSS